MDTVVNEKLINKHNSFVSMFQSEIDSGQVVLCDSMPSFEFWLLLHFADYKGLLKTYPQVSQVLAPYLKPYFDDNSKPFKKLIKAEKYLKKSDWVRRMLDENRLSQAVERAKVCLLRECEEPGKHSYTNVYKVFETNEG